MPYNTNVPNSGQSPGLFPAQGSDNFTRLKALLGANHKFNDTAASDDGVHQIVQILPTVAASVPNSVAYGQSFVNAADSTNQLSHKDSLNRIFQITPTIPIYAAVKFVGTAASPIAGVNLLYAHNVTNVTYTVAGQYEINFTTALPSLNYVVLGMVQSGSTTGLIRSFSGTYNQAFNSLFTIVQTFTLANSLAQFQTVQVLVVGG